MTARELVDYIADNLCDQDMSEFLEYIYMAAPRKLPPLGGSSSRDIKFLKYWLIDLKMITE